MRLIRYGADPSQLLEVGADGAAGPVLVLLHGGYWRAQHGRDLMWPLAADLQQRGWTVANVEYRRGTGYQHTVTDVGAALALTRELMPGRPLILIGHSAGGHLALLHAGSADALVALAPVTDLARGYREKLGEDAVLEFLQATPQACPETYFQLSPSPAQLTVPSLFVHGPQDQRVPVEHTDAFVLAASAAPPKPAYLRPAGTGHLDLIDPAAAFWSEARAWLHRLRVIR